MITRLLHIRSILDKPVGKALTMEDLKERGKLMQEERELSDAIELATRPAFPGKSTIDTLINND